DTFEGPHRLTLSPAGDGPVRLFGVSMEVAGPGVLVDAIGIRGRMAKTWLRWDEDLFRESLQTLNPNVVVIAYGTNEASDSDYSVEHYSRDLRKTLDLFRRVAPDKGCILVGPSDRGKKMPRSRKKFSVWERTKLIAEAQRDIAPEYGCVFWDWQQAMGGEGSMVAWRYTDPPLAAKDLLHNTSKGYIHIAERFIEALDDAARHYR
ncbi:MAG: GDSL-type esterase/lipase family protein, partial [Myxococcota bacterium]|nr:GDSL-type esterase/lipase family protein [Myxococcota bacterium]